MYNHYNQWSPVPQQLQQMQNPYYPHSQYQMPQTHQLKQTILSTVEPLVQYGLKEGKATSYPHAMREVAAISYLMGRGYDLQTARRIVESWEINEYFY